VLEQQCINRRIGEFQKLQHEVACWKKRRNEKHAGINWTFTIKRAERKFGGLENYLRRNKREN
jgi:hypothetical protein